MFSSCDPFPEVEHVHIAQLRGQVSQHGSHHRAKGEGPHFKEDRKSTGGIFGDATIAIKGFKPRQRSTNPKHAHHKNIEGQSHPDHGVGASAAVELTDKVRTQECHRIGNDAHGDTVPRLVGLELRLDAPRGTMRRHNLDSSMAGPRTSRGGIESTLYARTQSCLDTLLMP